MSESWHARDENSYVAPEGWYESDHDPQGTERYWDGAKWTMSVRFVGVVGEQELRASDVPASRLGYIAPPGYRSRPGMMGVPTFVRSWPEESRATSALVVSLIGLLFPPLALISLGIGMGERTAIDAGRRSPRGNRKAAAAIVISAVALIWAVVVVVFVVISVGQLADAGF